MSVIDKTKRVIAFSDIAFKSGTTNADIGGGNNNDATIYLLSKSVANIIYDPVARPKDHNLIALEMIFKNKTDTATSFGVLNAIESKENREKHIKLIKSCLKSSGLLILRFGKEIRGQ